MVQEVGEGSQVIRRQEQQGQEQVFQGARGGVAGKQERVQRPGDHRFRKLSV